MPYSPALKCPPFPPCSGTEALLLPPAQQSSLRLPPSVVCFFLMGNGDMKDCLKELVFFPNPAKNNPNCYIFQQKWQYGLRSCSFSAFLMVGFTQKNVRQLPRWEGSEEGEGVFGFPAELCFP